MFFCWRICIIFTISIYLVISLIWFTEARRFRLPDVDIPSSNYKNFDSVWDYWWSLMRIWRHAYRSSDNSSYYEPSQNDKKWCEWDLYNQYICISDWLFTQETLIKNKINDLKIQLDAFIVNQYSQSSVNAYNSLVNSYNLEINSFNNFLKNNCEPAYEYCKPYNCNKKYPWTIYKKESDMCVCDNNLPYDEIKKECPIKNKIPVVPKKVDSISSSWNRTETIVYIVYILLWIWILRFLIDKYNGKNTRNAKNNQIQSQNNQNSQSKPKSYFDEIMENK